MIVCQGIHFQGSICGRNQLLSSSQTIGKPTCLDAFVTIVALIASQPSLPGMNLVAIWDINGKKMFLRAFLCFVHSYYIIFDNFVFLWFKSSLWLLNAWGVPLSHFFLVTYVSNANSDADLPFVILEGQIVKTDTTNILIRSLQISKQKSEANDAKAAERGKGKR